MYHFIKFNNTWYLKPEKLEDVTEHFKKFCGREFKEGFEDFRDNVSIKKDYNGEKYLYSKNHSSSLWRYAVEMTMQFGGESWLNAANSLEEQTYKNRIERFLEGKPIFLTDGLPYFPPKEWPEYDEEVWKDELEFPYKYNYEDCRFLQWSNGRHWYVKIGNIDIGDKYGNYKFSDKSYAQKVAKAWCKCGGDWSKI
jgi:hypothetical protein